MLFDAHAKALADFGGVLQRGINCKSLALDNRCLLTTGPTDWSRRLVAKIRSMASNANFVAVKVAKIGAKIVAVVLRA